MAGYEGKRVIETKGRWALEQLGPIFELNLLENSVHNAVLFAAMQTGVGLPVSYSDGDTKIVGTGKIEDVPDSSKNTAGTTRTWRIMVVDSSTTYGASATT